MVIACLDVCNRTGSVACYSKEENIFKNDELLSPVNALGEGVQLVQAPAQILERKLHLPSAYLIIPIFALANAGIAIDFNSLASTIMHPISLGIAVGLVLGKLMGIAGFCCLIIFQLMYPVHRPQV